MPKVFTARGSDGLVAIHEPDADLNNPAQNPGKIYFHSHLNYLSLAYERDVVINTANKGVFTLFAHGMGRPVMFLAIRQDNQDVIGGTCIVTSVNQQITGITISSNSTNVMVRIQGSGSSPTSNLNIPVKIYIFDNPVF